MTSMSFPSLSFARLWHVGSMDIRKKRPGSHEGSGLSVSLHPDAWERINSFTAGDQWKLTKPHNRFLHFHRLTQPAHAAIAAWGVRQTLVEPATLFRVSWYDDEMEQEMYFDHLTREGAEEEADSREQAISEVSGMVATDAMLRRVGVDSLPTAMTRDLLTTLFVEDEFQWDGVWWADLLDVSRYSAPRGVISNRLLPTWTVARTGPFGAAAGAEG